MGYVLSIFLNALQTWLYTKLWDSFFIRRFSGLCHEFNVISQQMGSAIVCCNNRVFLLFFHCSADRKGIAVLFGHDASGVCV